MKCKLVVASAILTYLVQIGAWAAVTATVTVPNAGNRYYWFSYANVNGKKVVTTPVGFKDKKTTVDLPLVKDALPKCTLYIVDARTGNEALVKIDPSKVEGKAFKFDLKASDFDVVRRVNVEITSISTGQPAAAAVVKIEAAEDTVQTQVLDPSAMGIAQFTDVPSGRVKVTVEYGDGRTSSQDVDIPLDRDDVVAAIEMPVSGDIETIRSPAVDSAEDTETGASPGRESPQGSAKYMVANGIIGLVLLVIILGVVLTLVRNRGATLRRLLKKAGVDLPEEQPATSEKPSAATPVDPSICPFCGGKKDTATGACACAVGVSPTVVGVGSGSGPRLIATQGVYAGSIFALEGDTVTIGREESNAVVLAQDSTASRRHASITNTNGEFRIRDEGSSNGTFVNGVRIAEQVLQPGDEVQIGGTRLRFEA